MKVTKRDGGQEPLDIAKIRRVLSFACEGLNVDPVEIELDSKIRFYDGIKTTEIQELLIQAAVDKISADTPDYTYVAARLIIYNLYKEASIARGKEPYSPEAVVEFMLNNDFYSTELKSIPKDELLKYAELINPDYDKNFTYVGIKTLQDRYLLKGELPQELYLWTVVSLAKSANLLSLGVVKTWYNLLADHKVSLATPVLMNARLNRSNLTSCFVYAMDDSLRSIYETIFQIAQISKSGGGVGLYIGSLRAKNSEIQGFEGAASGVVPVMRVLNDTMVYVNQLGIRKGSCNVTLDVWHKDILDFLETKTNAGDERMKAHDLHISVSIPDLFMRRVQARKKWTLFDPHTVKKYLVLAVRDKYDKIGKFHTLHYDDPDVDYVGLKDGKHIVLDDLRLENLTGKDFEEIYESLESMVPPEEKVEIDAFELWKRILTVAFETGEPYIFFRDEANRRLMTSGIVYSSNLCMEIIQPMTPLRILGEVPSDDGKTFARMYATPVVPVCNLGAVNMGKVDDGELEDVIYNLVLMLNAVIEATKYPVFPPEMMAEAYRPIGIGVMNYHYRLAKLGIRWESEEHLKFASEYFERFAFYTLKASMRAVVEGKFKRFPKFEDTKWATGEYAFGRHISEIESNSKLNLPWRELLQEVKKNGIANAFLLALMPTGSTSLICGATPSIDPVFNWFYKEENMSGILPHVPPEVDRLKWLYKPAHTIDHKWTIMAAAERQKWIDQAQSLNLFIDPENITGKELSELYELAWELGLKTVYYLRSKSASDIDECEACSV